MVKFSKLPRPSSYANQYSGPEYWINMDLVAYIYDAIPHTGQQVNLTTPVAVQILPKSFRVLPIAPKTLVELDVPIDDEFAARLVGRIHVNPDLVVALSVSLVHEAVSTIYVLTDKVETLAELPKFRASGVPRFVAEKLGIGLA
jgi:hypothetical protein